MIISHLELAYDTPSLKACAATSFAWYYVAAPHLHHTLTIWKWDSEIPRRDLHPFPALDELGLLPLIKKVQLRSGIIRSPLVVPNIFNSQSLHCFSALVNLQDLTIEDLDFSKFKTGIEKYFGHFSPTLQSVALINPSGCPWQLPDFLILFPKLDDIKVARYRASAETYNRPDIPCSPVQGSLRGKLILSGLAEKGLLEKIITGFGEMRFIFMDLDDVSGAQLLLDACAEALQSLHLRSNDMLQFCKRLSERMAKHLN
jgi:hypothetical protein